MIQKEVAERLSATPGGKDYGAITLSVQFRCTATPVAIAPPNSFMPPPKVTSEVIRLDLRDKPPVKVNDEKMLFKVIKAAFAQRRKTLLNTLSNSGSFKMGKDELSEMLYSLGIEPQRRGETLSIEEYAKISDNIE